MIIALIYMLVIVLRAIYNPPKARMNTRKKPPIVMISGFVVMVEMTGVEPVSENPSI